MWASVSSSSIRILSYCRVLLPRVSATPTLQGIGSPALVFMDNTNNSSSGNSSFVSSARPNGRGGRERDLDMKNDRERSRGRRGGGGGGSSVGKDKIDALGRLMTRILRHMASELNLNVRSDGYVKVHDLLKLNMKTFANIPLKSHTVDDIREAVRKDSKQRFSLLEENGELLIRANQGHTITAVESERLLKPILSVEEVPVCVHGTYRKNLESILASGLKRMKRLHVHFSCGLPADGEVISGMRRDVNIMIFLDVKKALEEGMKLYISDNKVILTAVMELHQKAAVEDVLKKQSKKSDHLVLGPAAGQGLPNRLQCRGTRALIKTHFSVPSKASDIGDTVSLVTVFTIYNSSLIVHADNSLNLVTVGNASYNKEERSMAILNAFINFIQLTMPQSNIIILTDPVSDLAIRRNRVTVYPIQGEYSRDKLMLQRIRSYIAFLDTRIEELSQRQGPICNYIFTDSDIAVVGDLGHIFCDFPNFHVALTFRNNKAQPLNSGFIAVRGTHNGLLRAKIFLQEVLKVYISKYSSSSRMLGDQLALAWVVRSNPSFDTKRFSKAQPFLEDVGGTSVLFLPCATHNWTPPEGAGQFHGMPLDVKVVHFKGSRKRLMLESWNFFTSSSDISDMLCLILMSGRTKYDF
ncbi:hypothetical protein FNV43_RR18272 [Rhamnella rubrinervis]|uniref:2'-phosphotransferase n=1 Tax=Rhamnella rubrinervis TaxID=2594499 RepID=A0A8K0E5I4_9ROSA|nr:hypothetical protein FNV43_RR18272 [Rhamnella rubrinervis]